MQFSISIGLQHYDKTVIPYLCEEKELEKLFSSFPDKIISKKDARCFIATHFQNNRRLTENISDKSMIVLDLDNINIEISAVEALFRSKLQYYRYFAYSTASHSPEAPKIRIIFPLQTPVPIELFSEVTESLINYFNFTQMVDVVASKKPNQMMYLPIRSHKDYIPWSSKNTIKEAEFINYEDFVDFDALCDFNDKTKNPIAKIKDKTLDNLDTLEKVILNKPLEITTTEIKKYLKKYNVNDTDYHSWLQVGMALHHQYQGGVEGYDLWLQWSEKDNRYSIQEIKQKVFQKWNSLSSQVNPITFATIIKLVNNNKKLVNNDNIDPKSVDILPPGSIPMESWVHTYCVNKIQKPLNTLENLKVLLEFYNIQVFFDEITKSTVFYLDGKINYDSNLVITKIKSLCGLNKLSIDLIADFIYLIAKENVINTWKDYILSEPHDGIKRLDDFLATITVEPQYEEMKKIYITKWLMQMIHITCLNDDVVAKMARFVLVFQGNQNIGKTSWFRSLVPWETDKYLLAAQSLNVNNSMNILQCIKRVFVELGELAATFRKSDQEQLKNFLSSTYDSLNLKYIAHHVEYRRRTVFFGTINETRILQDKTGSSRFLILPIKACNTKHNINMQQLYAELYIIAQNDNNYYLNLDEIEKQKEINLDFQNTSTIEDKFLDIFDDNEEICPVLMNATKVLETIGFLPSHIKKTDQNEIANFLDAKGYRRSTRPRGWYLPRLKKHLAFD